jgi:hypothetical protein
MKFKVKFCRIWSRKINQCLRLSDQLLCTYSTNIIAFIMAQVYCTCNVLNYVCRNNVNSIITSSKTGYWKCKRKKRFNQHHRANDSKWSECYLVGSHYCSLLLFFQQYTVDVNKYNTLLVSLVPLANTWLVLVVFWCELRLVGI